MLPKDTDTLAESQAMLDPKKLDKKSRFSLKWLLRKTWDTKSPASTPLPTNSNHPPEKISNNIIPKSKSCDVSLSLRKETCCSPTVPYIKIVPRKISTCGLPSKTISTIGTTATFKTSYSSNDVQTLLAPDNIFPGLTSRAKQNQEPGCSRSFFKKPSFSNLSSKEEVEDVSPVAELLDLPTSSCIYKPTAGSYSIIKTPSINSIRSSSSNLLCRLCLMLVPSKDLYSLKECQCVFCRTCIQQYLTINIREGNVLLTCPDAQCGKSCQISTSEVEQLVDTEIYDMFQRYKLSREVELDPTRTWCPGINCETICYVRPSDSKQKSANVLVHCPNCESKFCSICKDPWHSKSCEQVRKDKQEIHFSTEQDDDPPIKRCPNPNCRVPIERDQGCAQMMCKQCKHVFCWYCLTSLDDDFLLRHYDKGPCKNKLGHSRASVVWHRTQVVGIFAGFGFLLLIASPLLLLAAPCLLCCRCKTCTKFFDDEPSTI